MDVNPFAESHYVLIDRIVQDLLQEDIDAVVRMGAVA